MPDTTRQEHGERDDSEREPAQQRRVAQIVGTAAPVCRKLFTHGSSSSVSATPMRSCEQHATGSPRSCTINAARLAPAVLRTAISRARREARRDEEFDEVDGSDEECQQSDAGEGHDTRATSGVQAWKQVRLVDCPSGRSRQSRPGGRRERN